MSKILDSPKLLDDNPVLVSKTFEQNVISPFLSKSEGAFEPCLSNYTTSSSSNALRLSSASTGNLFNNAPGISPSQLTYSSHSDSINSNYKTHLPIQSGIKRSIDEVVDQSPNHTNLSFDPATSLQGPRFNLPTPISPSFSFPGGPSQIRIKQQHPSALFIPGSHPGALNPISTPNVLVPLIIAAPPLSQAAPLNTASLSSDTERPKKKSKYSKEQDDTILELQKKHASWKEIAETVGCTELAARNRYQVLVGQQGGSSILNSDEISKLKALLEEGEKKKWKVIAEKFSGKMNKKVSPQACQRKIKQLFFSNPGKYGIHISYTENPTGPKYFLVQSLFDNKQSTNYRAQIPIPPATSYPSHYTHTQPNGHSYPLNVVSSILRAPSSNLSALSTTTALTSGSVDPTLTMNNMYIPPQQQHDENQYIAPPSRLQRSTTGPEAPLLFGSAQPTTGFSSGDPPSFQTFQQFVNYSSSSPTMPPPVSSSEFAASSIGYTSSSSAPTF